MKCGQRDAALGFAAIRGQDDVGGGEIARDLGIGDEAEIESDPGLLLVRRVPPWLAGDEQCGVRLQFGPRLERDVEPFERTDMTEKEGDVAGQAEALTGLLARGDFAA